MKQKDLKRQLKARERMDISQVHLRETIVLCRETLREAHPAPRIGFWAFVLRQVRFMDKKVWAAQLLTVGMLSGYLHAYGQSGTPEAQPLGMAIFGFLLALVNCISIDRSRQYQMLELELSTRMSLPRLLLAKTLITGVGALLAMTAVSVMVWSYAGMLLPLLAFTVCAYLLTSALCMGAVQLSRDRASLTYCLCTGVLVLCLLLMLNFGHREWLSPDAATVWWILCIPLAGAYIAVLLTGLKRQSALDWMVG